MYQSEGSVKTGFGDSRLTYEREVDARKQQERAVHGVARKKLTNFFGIQSLLSSQKRKPTWTDLENSTSSYKPSGRDRPIWILPRKKLSSFFGEKTINLTDSWQSRGLDGSETNHAKWALPRKKLSSFFGEHTEFLQMSWRKHRPKVEVIEIQDSVSKDQQAYESISPPTICVQSGTPGNTDSRNLLVQAPAPVKSRSRSSYPRDMQSREVTTRSPQPEQDQINSLQDYPSNAGSSRSPSKSAWLYDDKAVHADRGTYAKGLKEESKDHRKSRRTHHDSTKGGGLPLGIFASSSNRDLDLTMGTTGSTTSLDPDLKASSTDKATAPKEEDGNKKKLKENVNTQSMRTSWHSTSSFGSIS
jgi:hypothetical protein